MARRLWRTLSPRPVTSTPAKPVGEGSVDAGLDLVPVGEGSVDAGLDLVEVRLERLEEEAAAVGDASLCAISRSAGSVPAAKHLEGRLAALMALRRSMRRGERTQASLAELLEVWRRGLDDVTARDAGPDWRAYRAGGVDELEELAARHAGPDT